MDAWFMKFWQMVMDPSSKSSVLVRTYEYHADGCLMQPYKLSVRCIFSALLRTRSGMQVSRNIWVSLVLITGIT